MILLNTGRKRLLRVIWLVWMMGVVAGSLLPGNTKTMHAFNFLHVNDKVEHYIGYAVLAFLPALHERSRTAVALFLFSAALGVLLEFGQLYSPERSFDIYDMAADFIGVVSGAAIGWVLRTRTVS